LRIDVSRTPEEGAAVMADTGRYGGPDLEGPSVPDMPPRVHVGTTGGEWTGRGSLGGRVRDDDPAAGFFRQQAEAAGMTLAAFQREAGILTRWQEQEIREREVPFDDE